jgi:hypothetical protein
VLLPALSRDPTAADELAAAYLEGLTLDATCGGPLRQSDALGKRSATTEKRCGQAKHWSHLCDNSYTASRSGVVRVQQPSQIADMVEIEGQIAVTETDVSCMSGAAELNADQRVGSFRFAAADNEGAVVWAIGVDCKQRMIALEQADMAQIEHIAEAAVTRGAAVVKVHIDTDQWTEVVSAAAHVNRDQRAIVTADVYVDRAAMCAAGISATISMSIDWGWRVVRRMIRCGLSLFLLLRMPSVMCARRMTAGGIAGYSVHSRSPY